VFFVELWRGILTIIDNWDRKSHPMVKNVYGVWGITVPPTVSGQAAITHNSKIKVRISVSPYLVAPLY
jgi:hypothetical protein